MAAGLYDEGQIGTLYAPSPIIGRDATSGKFKLSIDWQLSDDLSAFTDFPADPGDVSVNGDGDIEFEFSSPENRSFYRVLIGE